MTIFAFERFGAGALLGAGAFAAGLSFGTPARADLCDDPATTCQAKLPAICLQRLGAGSVAAGSDADCGAAFVAYRDCLSEIAARCGTAPSPQAGDGEEAKTAWEAVKDSKDPAELDLVAKRYPNSFWGELAARRAESLRAAAAGRRPERLIQSDRLACSGISLISKHPGGARPQQRRMKFEIRFDGEQPLPSGGFDELTRKGERLVGKRYSPMAGEPGARVMQNQATVDLRNKRFSFMLLETRLENKRFVTIRTSSSGGCVWAR